MLWTFFVVFVAIWALGWVTSNTVGGVIHVLLVLAVVLSVLWSIWRHRAL